MGKIGVLVIRGSGGTGFERQKKFINKVNKRLAKNGTDTNQLIYEYIDWYEPMQSQQELLLERMFANKELKLKSKILRKLLITNIADLINYGGKPNSPNQIYEKTQELVHNSINRLQKQLNKNAPMIILASSMGTEIMNNYIWDRQHEGPNDPKGATAFERFETLVGLFTFGNNIPIFGSSTKIEDLRPIRFPAKDILPELKDLAIWENYYDKNDPLGYPIKFINTYYTDANVTDIQIGVGNILSFWNILSHFGYWTSKKIEKRISEFIIKVMEVTS
jgi:hypothetical protein